MKANLKIISFRKQNKYGHFAEQKIILNDFFFLFPRTPEVLSIPVGNSHIKTDGTLELNK